MGGSGDIFNTDYCFSAEAFIIQEAYVISPIPFKRRCRCRSNVKYYNLRQVEGKPVTRAGCVDVQGHHSHHKRRGDLFDPKL